MAEAENSFASEPVSGADALADARHEAMRGYDICDSGSGAKMACRHGVRIGGAGRGGWISIAHSFLRVACRRGAPMKRMCHKSHAVATPCRYALYVLSIMLSSQHAPHTFGGILLSSGGCGGECRPPPP